MRGTVSKILLWLFVINLGIAFGAGLYEARIVFPQWLSALPGGGYEWNAGAAREANSGLRFWVYVTTVPLTLLTLANLFAAWRAEGPKRRPWLAAAAVSVVERIFTLSYFIPRMVALQEDTSLAAAEAVAMASQWGALNNLRHLLTLIAWLLALEAFRRKD